jgi:ankyrin repeat protein
MELGLLLRYLFRFLTWPFFGLGLHRPFKRIPGVRIFVCRGEITWRLLPCRHDMLIDFSAQGQLEFVELFLCAGVSVNAPDEHGDTALIVAARGGHANVVTRLLSHPGTDLDLQNHNGESAWIAAIRAGHTAIDRLFESTDADRKAVPMWRSRAILERKGIFNGDRFVLLCRVGTPSDVQEFLDAGMDINQRDDGGEPAIVAAARREGTEVLELLLADGTIEVNARNAQQETALLWAARLENSEAVKLLVANGASEPDLEKRVARWQIEQDGLWADKEFVRAVNRADEALVRRFLVAGKNPNVRDEHDRTGLILAARNCSHEMVELLLKQPGTDVNARADGQVSALLEAAANGCCEIVSLLEQAGATVQDLEIRRIAERRIKAQEYRYDAATFVSMALQGQRDMVELFLTAGMNPDAANEVGDTPLIAAARAGDRAIVGLLLEKHANVNVHNRLGWTALDEAEAAGYGQIAQILRGHGAEHGSQWGLELLAAIEEGDLDVLQHALSQGASPDTRSLEGEPVLVVAVRRNQAGILERLLREGARADARDEIGRTAVMWAAATDRSELIVALLAQHRDRADDVGPSGRTALIIAAEAGNVGSVEALLRCGADPDIRDDAGRTALDHARERGHWGIARLLGGAEPADAPPRATLLDAVARRDLVFLKAALAQGAAPGEVDAEGNTALALAAAKGWNDGVKELLGAPGVDIELANREGNTPLMLAALGGSHQTLKLLLGHDPRPQLDAVNLRGETALFLGARERRGLVVKLLCEAGADPSRAPAGTSPLIEACDYGPLTSVQALLDRGADPNQVVRYGFSPLLTADRAGRTSAVGLLEERGARVGRVEMQLFREARNGNVEGIRALDPRKESVNARDRRGRTVLMEAAEQGHRDVVQLLLEQNADPAAIDTDGVSALKLAAQRGRTSVLGVLLSVVPSDEKADTDALLVAVENGHPQAVSLLAGPDSAAKVDGLSKGRVPLVVAAAKGNLQVVRTLVKHGADVKKKTRSGLTALQAAILGGHEEVAQYLVTKDGGGVKEANLLLAASRGNVEDVSRLLESPDPPDAEAVDGLGRTPLMRACEHGHRAVVLLLLAHLESRGKGRAECAVSVKDRRGRTPLMWAAVGGDEGIIRLLIEKYAADVSCMSETGRTALLEACRHGYLAAVQVLLDSHGDTERRKHAVNFEDNDGNTPLSEALTGTEPHRGQDYERIFNLLVESGAERGRERAQFLVAARVGDSRRLQDLIPQVEVDTPRLSGKTALMLAAENGYVKCVEVLLQAGARVATQSLGTGETALLLAARKGRRDVVALLLENHADPEAAVGDGPTALVEAVRGRHEDTVAELLKYQADPDRHDGNGSTPLMLAVLGAKGNDDRLVDLLLGAAGDRLDVDRTDFGNRTALTLAHLKGTLSGLDEEDISPEQLLPDGAGPSLTRIERRLLSHGARRGWNEAELVLAAHAGNADRVRALAAKADVNVPDLEGNTALLIAARGNLEGTAELLLDAGASPDIRGTSNRTVLMELAKNGSDRLITRILGAKSTPDLDAQDDNGETALLEAARAGATEIVVRLVTQEADVNLANRDGATPLIECARHAAIEPVRALLNAKANACAYSRDRRTAVLEAAGHGHEEVLGFLLEHVSSRLSGDIGKRRAVVNAVDGSKRTALERAQQNGHESCAALLLRYGALPLRDTGQVVYVAPSGDCFHTYRCPAIAHARRNDRLEEMFLDEARQKGLDLCIRCDPRLKAIDWTC